MIRGGIQSRLRMLAAMLAAAYLLSACGSSGGLDASAPSAAPANYAASVPSGAQLSNGSVAAYRLGSGDKLSVNVFGEADLSGEFLVGDDGRVDLPLIGAVQARGQTVTQFQNAVVARYSGGYLKDPKVSVSVLNYRPFFIQGEVGKGGEYPYKAGLTVQDAVAIAGGYTYRAYKEKFALTREDGRKVFADTSTPIFAGDTLEIFERYF